MDRDAIERRDFPVGRRGYDQAAVDEHLRRVADEIEALRGRVPAAGARAPMSADTSEQVRAILEAAERGAAQLREDAGRHAGDHVARVGEAAEAMLAHLEELDRELGSLLGSLRESSERLAEGLTRLQQQVGEVSGGEPAALDTAAPAPALDGDEAGARLIALNMALDGKPREETAGYLAERFDLADPEALLDDVYARVGG